MSPGTAITDGSLLVAVPVAVLAGLVAFASPCVLPLVPGFLGYVTGLTGVDLGRQRRRRLMLGALLFVTGFTAVFVVIGYVAGGLGEVLAAHLRPLSRLLGLVVVALGVLFLGGLPRLQRGYHLRWRPAAGLAGAPLLGAAFGLGWSPCTGPTLAAITALGFGGASAPRGALLASAYCAGLGVPFLLVAGVVGGSQRVLGVLRRHRAAITRGGGVLLIVVGLLLATGLWQLLVSALQVRLGLGAFETAL